MCPEVIAYYDPGADVSCIFTGVGGIVGGRLVGIPAAPDAGGSQGISDTGTGLTKVGFPTDGGWCFGIASHDAPQDGIVNVMRAPKVVPIECSAAVAAGQEITAGTDGRCKPRAAGNVFVGRNIGVATTLAGQYVKALLYADSSWSAT
jgi:hypothetical protein